MSEADLVLIHPPGVYDFRQEAILYGPLADLPPAPFACEAYPLGPTSLGEYLERMGYRVHILNLARRMLDDPQFDVEEAIASCNPLAFGVNFHWLTHAQGALAVAQMVKTCHPETPVILTGFAASYYHCELIDYPQVDYVLRGDTIEDPLLQLLECLALERVPDRVRGLTWRTQGGLVVTNPLGPPPSSLDDLASGGDGWVFPCRLNYPAAAGLMARGCSHNCLTCGNSSYACQRLYGRPTPIYRSPERLARDLDRIRRQRGAPVYVPGDITQAGMDYAYRFLQAMQGFPGLVYLDLFRPMPRKYLQDVAHALPRFALQISMDSHDPQVRQAAGKSYSNQAMEQTIADALALGCERLELHFTIGLPHQDYDSVMATVAYSRDLVNRFNGQGQLRAFIAPLAPFLSPASIAFEESERFGYRLRFRSLEEHRRALLAPTWKHVLNYETKWMTRDEMVHATYDAAVAMAHLRARQGLISPDDARELENGVERARRLMADIDRVLATSDSECLQNTLRQLKPDIDQVNHIGLRYSRLLAPVSRSAWPAEVLGVGCITNMSWVRRLFRGWRQRRRRRSQRIEGNDLRESVLS